MNQSDKKDKKNKDDKVKVPPIDCFLTLDIQQILLIKFTKFTKKYGLNVYVIVALAIQ